MVSPKHAGCQTSLRRHSSVAQNRLRLAGCIADQPSACILQAYGARLSVELLHPLFLPHCFTLSAAFQVLSLQCSSHHQPPALLSLSDYRSLDAHHLCHLSSLLILFLGAEARGRVTWQMGLQPHSCHFVYISFGFP